MPRFGYAKHINTAANLGNGIAGLALLNAMVNDPELIWVLGVDCAVLLINATVPALVDSYADKDRDIADLAKVLSIGADMTWFELNMTALLTEPCHSASALWQLTTYWHLMSPVLNGIGWGLSWWGNDEATDREFNTRRI